MMPPAASTVDTLMLFRYARVPLFFRCHKIHDDYAFAIITCRRYAYATQLAASLPRCYALPRHDFFSSAADDCHAAIAAASDAMLPPLIFFDAFRHAITRLPVESL